MRGWKAVPLALMLAACAAEEPVPAAPSPAPSPAPAPAPAPIAAPAPVASPAPPPLPTPAIPALTGTLPGDRVPIFETKVRRSGGAAPREEALDPRASKAPVVFVVMSTQCPNCADAVEPLRRAEAAFQPRGVDFVYLYPVKTESDEEKIAWHAGKGFRAGQVLDAGAEISKLLAVDKTPTAFLVGAGGGILYRGGVAEVPDGGGAASHPLADALDEHLSGRAISVPSTEPAG